MVTESDGRGDLPGETHVGRVALTVGDLDRAVEFYRDVVGLMAERDGPRCRLSAGERPLLELEGDPDAPERPPDAAGLFHVAIRVPTRSALADALARIRGSDAAFTGASDHLVSEALYLRDPEGNGVEIYRDRPRSEWPRREDGGVRMDTLPLDLDELASVGAGGDTVPAGTDVGHVHLEVTDLAAAEAFYVDGLGLGVMSRYGEEATFVAADGYHHHLGLNTWNHRRAPAGATRGLRWFELVLPDRRAVEAAADRLGDAARRSVDADGTATVEDPDHLQVRLVPETSRG